MAARNIARRIFEVVSAPFRPIDGSAGFDLDLTTDDLLADLDPAWLAWRESRSGQDDSTPIAA